MSPLLQPVQMFLLMFAGWVNRYQLDVIEYLQEENRVLKERSVASKISTWKTGSVVMLQPYIPIKMLIGTLRGDMLRLRMKRPDACLFSQT